MEEIHEKNLLIDLNINHFYKTPKIIKLIKQIYE